MQTLFLFFVQNAWYLRVVDELKNVTQISALPHNRRQPGVKTKQSEWYIRNCAIDSDARQRRVQNLNMYIYNHLNTFSKSKKLTC